MITIENNKIFVEGKETLNPELIGYAVIDAVEEGAITITKNI